MLNGFHNSDLYCFCRLFGVLSLLVNDKRRANFNDSALNINPQDDWVIFTEDFDDFENTRKNSFFSFFDLAFFSDFGYILGEKVSQVVNNICCEYFDLILLCVFLSILQDFDVEDQKASISKLNLKFTIFFASPESQKESISLLSSHPTLKLALLSRKKLVFFIYSNIKEELQAIRGLKQPLRLLSSPILSFSSRFQIHLRQLLLRLRPHLKCWRVLRGCLQQRYQDRWQLS